MIPINHIERIKKAGKILSQESEDRGAIIDGAMSKIRGLQKLDKQTFKQLKEKGETKIDWYNKKTGRLESVTVSDHARENLRLKHQTPDDLICPKCHETNSHGNKMGNKPYCFKCNLIMISREKAEKWVEPKPPPKRYLGFNEPDRVVLKSRRGSK